MGDEEDPQIILDIPDDEFPLPEGRPPPREIENYWTHESWKLRRRLAILLGLTLFMLLAVGTFCVAVFDRHEAEEVIAVFGIAMLMFVFMLAVAGWFRITNPPQNIIARLFFRAFDTLDILPTLLFGGPSRSHW